MVFYLFNLLCYRRIFIKWVLYKQIKKILGMFISLNFKKLLTSFMIQNNVNI